MSLECETPRARPPDAGSTASSGRPDHRNYRDLVIEQLADEWAEMAERAVRAEADVEVWRQMTHVALGQAARTMAQLQAARVEIVRLRSAGRWMNGRPGRDAA
jgi:hypothetical protein